VPPLGHRARRRPRRTRRRSRGSPSGGGEAAHRQTRCLGGGDHVQHRLAPVLGGPHDAALAGPARTELELRLDHAQQLAVRRQASGERREELGEGDEGDVHGDQRRGERKVARLEFAGVSPLHDDHAWIRAQARVELAVADVERGNPGGAALKQAVGEAPGRAADIEAFATGGGDPEPLQGVLELDPPAGDEARRLGHDQVGLRLNHLARLHRHRPVGADAHPPRPHRGGGGAARREEAALGESAVEPDLGHPRNRSAGRPACPGRL